MCILKLSVLHTYTECKVQHEKKKELLCQWTANTAWQLSKLLLLMQNYLLTCHADFPFSPLGPRTLLLIPGSPWKSKAESSAYSVTIPLLL